MKFRDKKPVIILIAGKARSGKNTLANYIKEELEKKNLKVVISPYTKYLKQYIESITNISITEENKPRDLLQKLSSELIKKKLGKENLLIERQLDDIEVYSYFANAIIIPDVRFPREIEVIKDKFNNVLSIGLKRENYTTDLTKEQQNDITEISLDNYNNYDIIVRNNNLKDLQKKATDIINELYKRRML